MRLCIYILHTYICMYTLQLLSLSLARLHSLSLLLLFSSADIFANVLSFCTDTRTLARSLSHPWTHHLELSRFIIGVFLLLLLAR